ncbi:PAS domain S-box protein [Flavobacteriaceae bacterium TP-CH-4]|uniref:histidine kinase n=1 Tax=Pelagihabitans pacificus TaxID=2696054 RepID=A0A967AQH5_9FLAO|nr:PAS domain-containing sensor histidine kinase [Pelagihabitans pacificus]NHF58566.1 PAS domain S-box protein [Pelagihabitans pacificus]
MAEKEVLLLKKALERQKKARIQAEKILEEKSKELYDVTQHLKEANSQLENLLNEKTSELDGVFINIIDPYVVMDLKFNVINMNRSAKEFLGYDHNRERLNLKQLVHPEYLEYTWESIQSLLEVGTLKNYRAKIFSKDGTEKWVQINSSLIYDKERKPIAAQGIIRDITNETEIRQLLDEQKRQLDIIVGNSPLGIALTIKGKIIKVNPAFENLLGYSEYELKRLHVKDITVPEENEESIRLIDQMNKGRLDTFSIVKKYLRKDGTTLFAKTTVSAVKNHRGDVDYQVALVEDISKEREAEERTKASENRLATLISNLQTGVLLEDEHRTISLTNQMFCDLFHIPVTPESLKGADCSNAAEDNKKYFKDPENFVNRIETILQNRKVVLKDELEMIDGSILERDYIPIFNQDIYKGHLWTYQDVTLRKNYKRNLEAQKEKYSSIIANMNLGLIEVDLEDTIQLVNQSFCNMSGFAETELVGQKASEVLNLIERDLLKEKNEKRLLGESDSYEVRVAHKDGRTRHWLISGAPRYNEAGQAVGSIGIHLDITDQKQLELQKEKLLRELESSNQGLQEYAHIVSHDLKSPLRSISALASWLAEDYKEVLDDNGLFNLQQMQEKVESMDRLISGILKYSSISHDTSEHTQVDLNAVVNEIREIIFIPEHVNVLIMNTLPVVLADRTKIYQLFQNLIGNAVVHIEAEQGLVEISSSETRTHWQFNIKDNGIGIAPEYHEKIFKIFQSIGNGERSTGIGLSIVKKIIDLYEGSIWLDSTIGQGTTFHFTLKK